MNFIIDDEIFDAHPDVKIGLLTAHGLDNHGQNHQLVDQLREAEAEVREKFTGHTISELPFIKPWRDAYRQFGAKPKKYPSSIENLLKRITKGAELGIINNLVTAYNIVSLRHLLPVGGEDLDQMQGDIQLTVATANEAAVRLLGEREERPPYEREIIYKDDIGTICRRWNWKEADRTKLTAETQNAMLVIEAIPPITRESLIDAMHELGDLVNQYCGGRISVTVLDKDLRQILMI